MPRRTGGGALVLAFLASACPGNGPEKSEAAAVSRAVTSLREADNPRKSAFLGALRDTPCNVADICAVRSACLAAYELQVRTLERTRDAAKPSGSATIETTLDEIKRELARAHELSNACADAQGALIRRYKL